MGMQIPTQSLPRRCSFAASLAGIVMLAFVFCASAESAPISAAEGLTCAIDDGAATCWGMILAGEFPEGQREKNSTDVPRPVPWSWGLDFSDIALSADHACAVADGAAVCWGLNDRGQLGDGTQLDSEYPVEVEGLSEGVTDVAVRDGNSCAIHLGVVKCWGARNAAVAVPAGSVATVPQTAPGSPDNAIRLADGSGWFCAVVNGSALCWISTAGPQQPAGLATGVEELTTGASYACAVVSGSARCWGVNSQGELGDGTTVASHASTQQVVGLTSGVTAISSSSRTSCAVHSGAVKCWGVNSSGQYGNGTIQSVVDQPSQPVQASGIASGADAVAVGDSHVCARQSGEFKCWGRNWHGELGDGLKLRSPAPAETSGSGALSGVSVGYREACATNAGALFCWGREANHFGGDGYSRVTSVPASSASPLGLVTSVGHHDFGACHVNASGGSCVGFGGQSISGATSIAGSDLRICGAVGPEMRCVNFVGTESQVGGISTPATDVSGGTRHFCARASGSAYCWNGDEKGQLGDGKAAATSEAVVPIGLSSGVTSIDAGAWSSCAVKSGAAWCWGSNEFGQLGDGTYRDRDVPVMVDGLETGVEKVSVGNEHACALLSDQTIRCWGRNVDGRLGSGDEHDSTVPRPVTGLIGAVEVSAGFDSTCARISASLVCWGSNEAGQLGVGGNFHRTTPANVVDAEPVRPVVEIIDPVDGGLFASSSVAVDVFTAGDESLECLVDGKHWQSCTDVTGLEDGRHSLLAEAIGSNNSKSSRSVRFVVDTTPPTLTINSPVDSLAVGESQSWSIGRDEPLAEVRCSYNDLPLTECFSFWPSISGEYVLRVEASDLAGNVGTATKKIRIGPPPAPMQPPPPAPAIVAPPALSRPQIGIAFKTSGKGKKRQVRVTVRLTNRGSALCNGRVSIGSTQLGRSVPVTLRGVASSACTASRIFKLPKRHRGTKIKFTVDFPGNSTLLPAARSVTRRLR